MKLSLETLEKKFFLGYIINMAVVVAIGFIYIRQVSYVANEFWYLLSLALIVLSLAMLTIVFFMLKAQIKAKKQASDKLLKNEKLLESIINNTTNAISVKKINGEYILVNKKFQSLFEADGKNLVGSTNHDFLPKEIADRYRSADLEVVKTEKEIQLEEVIQQADGQHTYLSVKFPLFDLSNRIYAIGNISTDITERKAVQESLKAADTFFNMSIDGFIIASETTFLKINPSLGKLLGYTNEELLGKPFISFIVPEDVARTQKNIAKLEKGAALVNFKNRWICKDGSIKWLSWNAAADKATGLLYAIARDITEKLKLEEEEKKAVNDLYENQQKLNTILENVSDGVLVINPKKEVVLANYMAHELFGTDKEANMSADFSNHFKIYYPDGKETFPAQDLPSERGLKGEITDNIEVVLEDLQTNKKRRLLLSGRPIIDNKDQVIAAVVTLNDIGKYKKMEEKLKQTELKYRKLIGYRNS